MAIEISSSVGKGGTNKSKDVREVERRLSELGFSFFPINGQLDAGLIMSILLFQSIIKGRNSVSGDGRIDVGGGTIRFLQAANAPVWTTMPISGVGFVNFEAQDLVDQHDFGTNWLAETIVAAGAAYERNFQRAHPDAAPIAINDVSLPTGGDTPDHAGHETGLACDTRLPRIGGGSGGIANPNTNGAYDRDAMRAQLLAIREQPLFARAFFNDNALVDEGLCARLKGHHNHLHFEITAPDRQ
jgi:hypothetical protein